MYKLVLVLTFLIQIVPKAAVGQDIIFGKVDGNGLKQGLWKVKYNSHSLIPKKTVVYSLCNYINGKIEGSFYLYSQDSLSYLYVFNAVNDLKKGLGYMFQNKKISESYYFTNDTSCVIHEFGYNGQVNRIYESTYNMNSEIVFSGEYLEFWKGKLVRTRKYSRSGKMLSESSKEK
jgi:hypothetical protein